MHLNDIIYRGAAVLGAAVLAVALSTGVGFAASDYVGKYKTEDTQGNAMTITLSEDGSASGQRADETLTGKWKEKKDSVVINWEDGWTTKLVKKDGKYRKMAYEKGKRAKGEPTDTSEAEKIE